MRRVAFLIHGFFSSANDLEEIAIALQDEQLFDHIVLIDLYDSPKGLNFLKHPNILSPIHDPAFGKKALDQFVLYQLLHHQNEIITTTGDKNLELYFFCHSLGGLVIRSVLQNLLQPTDSGPNGSLYIGQGRVRAVITLGTAHQGSYLGTAFSVLRLPLQSIFEVNKTIFSIMGKMIEKEAVPRKKLAMSQFSKASDFIKHLNVTFDALPHDIFWISVAGRVNEQDNVTIPIAFRRLLKNSPNDGVIEVSATILPNFRQLHILVDDCSHGDLIRWKSTKGGAEVWSILKHVLTNAIFLNNEPPWSF